jgi:hypothetical protein
VGDADGGGVMSAGMTRDAVIERLLQARLTMVPDDHEYKTAIVESDLPAFWRECGYQVFAEIGVERAHYTKHLLKTMPDARVYAVDPWLAYGGYREHVTQEKLDGFYIETQARLAEFGDRARVVRANSVEAAVGIPPESLDVVYIDGNHTLPWVIADLHAWVPKVRPGGMVCGHDYGRRRVGHVKEAVVAWTTAYDIKPWFLFTGDRSWTWGFVK